MSIFTLAVMIIAVITAFTFGMVTGESLSRRDYIIDQWEDEDDDEHSGDDR